MSEVPSEVMAQAAKSMLASIYQERAKFEVQQQVNAHDLNDLCLPGVTYADKLRSLAEGEARLREKYAEYLD